MSKLAAAAASVNSARIHLDAISRKITDLANLGAPPADLSAQLSAIENDLFERVGQTLSSAADDLTRLQGEDLGADAQQAVAALQGLLTAAHVVTSADVDTANAAVVASVKMYAARVDTADVAAVDQARLTASLESFKDDIRQQVALGDKISKVVSTVVGIGRTAVKVLV